MKVMVVGGGGREHAIIKHIKKNKKITEIFALPGNGGISQDAVCIPIEATDIDAVIDFAVSRGIDFAVVAQDAPLVMGAVDRLNQKGIAAFGPDAAAAQIEGSKVFAKNLMKKYNIPTAEYEVFENAGDAVNYITAKNSYPVVVKADGLALGKGVIIALNEKEAVDAIDAIMKDKIFGESGAKVVIEQFLTGPEVSVLCFTDGKTIVPMVSSMDHKRALDDDEGLNTGGMGTVAPNPFYPEVIARRSMAEIFLPTMRAMNQEGRKFKGCLYFGLMLTGDGPKVIEYNCRFGDPEAQVVLPLLKTDLFDIMQAVSEERLGDITVAFSEESACCVIIASGGYPLDYEKGKEISGIEKAEAIGAVIFHAGTALKGEKLVTSGGRVLGVTAVGDSLESAVDAAYKAAKCITFEKAYMRGDIGKKALKIVEGRA